MVACCVSCSKVIERQDEKIILRPGAMPTGKTIYTDEYVDRTVGQAVWLTSMNIH